ncbi:MAG: aminotransferase class V-fold PLP-dependent enzyme, partial [Rickettsiales bacterium]
GKDVPRLPNTTCIAMPGVTSETQLMAFDLEGIAVSAGSACSSGKIEPSRVIRALGFDEAIAATAIRISGGWDTSEADVQQLIPAWKKLYDRAGKKTSQAVG